jgi:uncharacterized membrane protein YkgB
MLGDEFYKKFRDIDRKIRNWMDRFGISLLRVSLGIVFFWFGFLKFFQDLSPAETLAQQTIEILTFGLISPGPGLKILATWECVVGIGLLMGKWMRIVLLLLWLQMIGAMSPIVLFPAKVFVIVPWVPTLEGQYIIKNLVLISAAIVLGSTLGPPSLQEQSSHRDE